MYHEHPRWIFSNGTSIQLSSVINFRLSEFFRINSNAYRTKYIVYIWVFPTRSVSNTLSICRKTICIDSNEKKKHVHCTWRAWCCGTWLNLIDCDCDLRSSDRVFFCVVLLVYFFASHRILIEDLPNNVRLIDVRCYRWPCCHQNCRFMFDVWLYCQYWQGISCFFCEYPILRYECDDI